MNEIAFTVNTLPISWINIGAVYIVGFFISFLILFWVDFTHIGWRLFVYSVAWPATLIVVTIVSVIMGLIGVGVVVYYKLFNPKFEKDDR